MNANCSYMVDLSSSRSLNLSLIFNLLTSSLGLPTFIWASCKLWTGTYTRTIHNNLRLLVQMYLLGFILHCYGRVILHALDLYNYHFRQPCDMIPDVYRCFVFRLMYNTGMWITTCTAVSLALERSIATYRRGKYEKSSILLGFTLAVLQVSQSFDLLTFHSQILITSFPLLFAYSNTKFDGVFMPYCSVYKPGHPEIAQINAMASIGAQAAARGLFHYLFYLNQKFRDSMDQTTLSTRFQIVENKNTMQCLKIYANVSTGFLFIQTTSFMCLIRNSGDMKPTSYLALMEMNVQYPLYGMLSVWLVAKKIHSIRQKIDTDLSSRVNISKEQNADLYRDAFDKQIGAPLGNMRKI